MELGCFFARNRDLARRSCQAATVVVAFGGYLLEFLDVPVTFSALLLLLLCTAFNIWGMTESSWANLY